MDIVYIRELRIETIIGIHPRERRTRQTVTLDLEMAADIVRAADTDTIGSALDYHAVATRLTEFVAASDCRLVETLAQRCAALLMEEFGVPWLRLRLGKPGALAETRDVGVIVERGERPHG